MNLIAIWAGLVCSLAITGFNRDAISFNNALSDANRRIAKGGEAWANAAVAAMSGGQAAVERFEAAEDELQKVLDDVKADVRKLEVPDSPAARRLYDAHQQFLRGQDEIIGHQFAKIGKVIADPTTPQEAKLRSFIELAQQAERRELQDLLPLQQAQREFAKENGFTVKEP